MTKSQCLNHKIRDIWYSATRFQDICPTNKSIIWNSVYVSQSPICQPLSAYWQSQLLCTYCQLHTAFLLLSMCEKLSKYRYWWLIILLHLHHYLIQKLICFSLRKFSSIIVKRKYQTPPSDFSKNIIYDTMDKKRSPIPHPFFSEINSGYTNVCNISYGCFFLVFLFMHAQKWKYSKQLAAFLKRRVLFVFWLFGGGGSTTVNFLIQGKF